MSGAGLKANLAFGQAQSSGIRSRLRDFLPLDGPSPTTFYDIGTVVMFVFAGCVVVHQSSIICVADMPLVCNDYMQVCVCLS